MITNKNFIISNVYEVLPSDVKYDIDFSKFNPKKSDEEYETLLIQIKEQGQHDPCYFKNGLLGDGTHRVMACAELGIKVKVVDIDPTISDKDYLLLCNKNTFAARNDSTTQLAIKAYNMVDKFKFSMAEAAQYTGLKDKRVIGYAKNIKLSKLNDKFKILETLIKGESVNINGKTTRSIDVVNRMISKIEEEELMDKEIINESKPEVDYNEMIETEFGKEMFWKIWKNKDLHSAIELVDTVNKFVEMSKEIKQLKDKLNSIK